MKVKTNVKAGLIPRDPPWCYRRGFSGSAAWPSGLLSELS